MPHLGLITCSFLLTSLLISAISALSANQTDDPSLSNLDTNLTTTALTTRIGPACTPADGDPTHRTPVTLDACLQALSTALNPRNPLPPSRIFLPSFWSKSPRFPGEKFSVPITWSDPLGACHIVVDAEVEGRTAVAQFSLVGLLNYASIVVDTCVNGEKTPLGGRFTMTGIAQGGFYVDVTGDRPLGLGGEAEEGRVGNGTVDVS